MKAMHEQHGVDLVQAYVMYCTEDLLVRVKKV